MEITIKHYDTTVTIKKEHDDHTIYEVFDMINTALLGICWNQSQIDEYIIEKSEQLKSKQ